jgi:FtsP/CotA-like multicopper oxidase with cupredoxin domain
MKSIFVTIILWFSLSLGASADTTTTMQLIPKKGNHQFPFFNNPTPVWAYNGKIPGPTIRGMQGTTIDIDLFNQLKEPTSVHWHGLRIDNAMDGVPGVTQEPIAPGGHFIYRLKLEEAGTFWYHPHLNAGEQIERGLKGVIIVDEPEKQPWSQDVVWLLDDWRLQKSGEIYPHFNTGHDLMHDGRWGNVPTVNGQYKPEFFVSPGERIRLRLINGANARIFSPRLVGLDADVIAVDGRPVSTVFPYDVFNLSPGNRIDLDITIPADAAGKTFQMTDTFTRKPFIITTIKVRNEAAVQTPVFRPPTAGDFIPADVFAPLTVGKTWDLNAIRGGEYGIGWSMNRKLWPNADKSEIPIGQAQKIIFKNSSSRLHPMHIHGVFFRVLERNGNQTVEPFTRDTVLIGPKETVTIGLIPEHEGIWLTHCHIQSHAESGMMTTISVQ